MKRILHCLAALAFSASASGAQAQTPQPAQGLTIGGLATQALADQGLAAQDPSAPPPTAEPAPAYDPIGDVLAAVTESGVENASAWALKATLYHGGGGMRARDSLGCPVAAMRTVAVDPAIVSRHTIIFIKETVGMPLPGGGVHDGYWYASDVGGGIKGRRIDLFTGATAASMRPMEALNLQTLTVTKVGSFTGCPPTDGGAGLTVADAR